MITLVVFFAIIGFYCFTFLQFGKLLLCKVDRVANSSYVLSPFLVVEPNLSKSDPYWDASLDARWSKVALRRLFCSSFYLM